MLKTSDVFDASFLPPAAELTNASCLGRCQGPPPVLQPVILRRPDRFDEIGAFGGGIRIS